MGASRLDIVGCDVVEVFPHTTAGADNRASRRQRGVRVPGTGSGEEKCQRAKSRLGVEAGVRTQVKPENMAIVGATDGT